MCALKIERIRYQMRIGAACGFMWTLIFLLSSPAEATFVQGRESEIAAVVSVVDRRFLLL